MAKPKAPRAHNPRADRVKEFVTVFLKLAYRNSPDQVFRDFVEMAACVFSNADLRQQPERETRYRTLINSYQHKEDRDLFPILLGETVYAFEQRGPHDFFGEVWRELLMNKGIDMGNKWKGQFFTPFNVSHMMAKMNFHDMRGLIEEKGFITACEPACGPGGMIAAMALALEEDGHNYQQCLHVTGVDIDLRCVHMTYVTCSLLHIPAIIIHGNSLSNEEWSTWYTPAHIMGGWSYKLARRKQLEAERLQAEPPPLQLAAE